MRYQATTTRTSLVQAVANVKRKSHLKTGNRGRSGLGKARPLPLALPPAPAYNHPRTNTQTERSPGPPMSKPTDVRLTAAALYLLPVETRVPHRAA